MEAQALGAISQLTLLDTDVLIELRRGSLEASEWFKGLDAAKPLVPYMAAMEFIGGSVDKHQLARSRKFLEELTILPFEERDSAKAFDLVVKHRLSTGLSLPDFMIAAQAAARDMPLYTFNLKHFKVIDGLDARQPYPR